MAAVGREGVIEVSNCIHPIVTRLPSASSWRCGDIELTAVRASMVISGGFGVGVTLCEPIHGVFGSSEPRGEGSLPPATCSCWSVAGLGDRVGWQAASFG